MDTIVEKIAAAHRAVMADAPLRARCAAAVARAKAAFVEARAATDAIGGNPVTLKWNRGGENSYVCELVAERRSALIEACARGERYQGCGLERGEVEAALRAVGA
jgi:hypothetical protein